MFNKMAEGGTISMPLANQFWGAKFGMLKDKYGIGWMFNYEIKNAENKKEDKTLDITD